MATPFEANDILLTMVDTNNILGNTKYKYENGIISQTYNKKKYWRRYFTNGVLWSYGHYINEQHENTYLEYYYMDGTLGTIKEQKNGKPHGTTVNYNKNGSIIQKRKYDDGVLLQIYMI